MAELKAVCLDCGKVEVMTASIEKDRPSPGSLRWCGPSSCSQGLGLLHPELIPDPRSTAAHLPRTLDRPLEGGVPRESAPLAGVDVPEDRDDPGWHGHSVPTIALVQSGVKAS